MHNIIGEELKKKNIELTITRLPNIESSFMTPSKMLKRIPNIKRTKISARKVDPFEKVRNTLDSNKKITKEEIILAILDATNEKKALTPSEKCQKINRELGKYFGSNGGDIYAIIKNPLRKTYCLK